MIRDLAIRCDAAGCVRGVVHLPAGFGDPCQVCGGRGSISLGALCKHIGECESTMRKLFKPRRRMRAKVAARICGKLVDLVSPKWASKQGSLFGEVA